MYGVGYRVESETRPSRVWLNRLGFDFSPCGRMQAPRRYRCNRQPDGVMRQALLPASPFFFGRAGRLPVLLDSHDGSNREGDEGEQDAGSAAADIPGAHAEGIRERSCDEKA